MTDEIPEAIVITVVTFSEGKKEYRYVREYESMYKPVRMWAVYLPNGTLLKNTIASYRQEAIDKVLACIGTGINWSILTEVGYHVIEVEVREVEQ